MDKNLVTEVVATLAEHDGIPDIRFKQGSVLGDAVAMATSVSTSSGDESASAMAKRYVDEFLYNRSDMVEMELEKISDVLAHGMRNSIMHMRELHRTVNGVIEDINKRVDLGIALNPKLEETLMSQEVEVKYNDLDLSGLSAMGSKASVMSGLDEEVGNRSTTPPLTKYETVIGRYVQMMTADTMEIGMDKEELKVLAEEVSTKHPSLQAEDVLACMELLVSEKKISTLQNAFKRDAVVKTDNVPALMAATKVVNRYAPMIKVANQALIGHGVDEMVNSGNFKAAYAVVELAFYITHYQMEHNFSGVAILKNELKNPLVASDLEENGITDMYIARFIKTRLRGNLNFSSGISVERLKDSFEEVNKTYEEASVMDSVAADVEVRKLRRNAFNVTLSEYLAGKGKNISDYVKARGEELVSSDVTLDSLLYGILIQEFHAGTVLGSLHKNLGNAYMQAVIKNPSVDTLMANKASLKAYMDVASEVIAKNMIN